MENLWLKLIALWDKIPTKTQTWIKGAEVAIVTAVVAYSVAVPAADLTTRKGIAEFATGVLGAAYGALRLYLAQSPVTALVKRTTKETDTVGEVSHILEISTTTQGGPTTVSPNDPHTVPQTK